MKTKALIGLAILLLIITGTTAYLRRTSLSSSNSTSSTTTSQPSSTPTKLSDWLKKKTSVVCTLNQNGHTTTIYLKGDKIRVDGLTHFNQDQNQTQKSYYIQDDQYAYIWTEGKPNGTKYPLKSFINDDEDNSETNNNAPQKFDLKEMEAAWEGMDYKCTPKNLSDSTFTPPSNIKFVDLENMFQQMQQSMPDMDMSQTND